MGKPIMIVEALKWIDGIVRGEPRPTTIDVQNPSGHVQEQEVIGRYLLKETVASGGQVVREYVWDAVKRAEPQAAAAERVFGHQFDALESLAKFVNDRHLKADIYVRGCGDEEDGQSAEVLAILDEQRPEIGKVSHLVGLSDAAVRWRAVLGAGTHQDVTHEEFAAALMDNREDVVDKAGMAAITTLRAAKQIDYEASLEDASAMRLAVTWRLQKDGVGTVTVPRELPLRFPFFVGGAPVDAVVRLRLLPPRGSSEDVAPRFRLLWVNAAECWAAALNDLAVRAGALMPTHPVFRGTPEIIHYR